MFTIEKNIPITERKTHEYPFTNMEIDDSFLVNAEGEKAIRTLAKQLSSHASQAGKTNQMKFSIRSVDEGVRCWRTE